MKIFFVTQDTDLKTFTDQTFPQGSFCFTRLLKEGDVKINSVRAKSNVKVRAGDQITYYTTLKEEAKPSHATLYEDESVLIVDKLSGVTSEALFKELEGVAPHPVHRLDRNTQGLIVLAKTEAAKKELEEAFKSRTVIKTYLCIAKSAFTAPRGTLIHYLKKGGQKVEVYDRPAPDALTAITDYEVLKSVGELCLVKLTLHTGRTHQIRASLAHAGCPVLGDTKYGDFALNKKYKKTRQQLLSYGVKFPQLHFSPALSSREFHSTLPIDFPDV